MTNYKNASKRTTSYCWEGETTIFVIRGSVDDNLSARLKIARKQAGLSQKQVGHLLGLHRPSISQIECGKRSVKADELVRFSEIYGVNVEWLVGTESESQPFIGRAFLKGGSTPR